MTELPEEVKREIEKEARKYSGSSYMQNHQPAIYNARFLGFNAGADFIATKLIQEKQRTCQMILRLKVEFAGDEYWLNEIDEFLSK